MADHDVNANVQQDAIHPDCPAPTPQQEDPCEGDLTLSGKLVMPCCCPRLYTRTFILDLPPQTETALTAQKQATVNAWETAGYLILAHSTEDTGAGTRLGLTVAWYA